MNTRNRFLDLIKLLACFLVIVIHTKGIGVAYEYVLALTRWAVPFFFVITGMHFFKNDLSKENIRKCALHKGLHFLKLLLIVNFVYLLYSLCWYLCYGYTLKEWLYLKFSLSNIARYIINSTLVKDNSNEVLHLWYLVSIIKCSVIFILLAPIFQRVYKLITVELLSILYLVNYMYGNTLKSIHLNWVLIGLTFLQVGIFIEDYLNTKIYTLSEGKKIIWQLKVKQIAPLFIIMGTFITIIETYFIGIREIYFGSLIIVVSLILLSECNIEITDKIDCLQIVPANIYYYHVLFLNVFNLYIPQITWYKPFIIMLVCGSLFYLLQRLKERGTKVA